MLAVTSSTILLHIDNVVGIIEMSHWPLIHDLREDIVDKEVSVALVVDGLVIPLNSTCGPMNAVVDGHCVLSNRPYTKLTIPK
jgi:hypothetical protein